MNLTAIEKELRALIALAQRWEQQGYTPNIERDIALNRVRNIYNAMLELQCELELQDIAPEVEQKEQPVEEQEKQEPAKAEEKEEEQQQGQKEEQKEEQQPKEPAQEDLEQKELQLQRQRFIHDLFCNDETFFEQEMHKISLLGTMDDVLIYIGEKYAWSPENHTAEEFVSKISIRFE